MVLQHEAFGEGQTPPPSPGGSQSSPGGTRLLKSSSMKIYLQTYVKR